ncbi:hypothetical protein Goshw_023778 [Gossypium schwendimanii]|uniref:Uncharacterized protein n=1 Tax=Gossypium schwendimanii TaxID=34291 RepID=A0A7J9MX09_GOSSC|nr:hypothetical protein [Gossypium schwendimanii]
MPPNNPPFSILSIIKHSFHDIGIMLSQFKHSFEANNPLTLPISRSTPQATANSITRIRCCSAAGSLGASPICNYINSFEIEMQSHHRQPRPNSLSLGKTIMSLAFQAVFALALSSSTEQADHHHLLLPWSAASMVMAFAASFSWIFFHTSHPRIASIIGNTASVIAALGFFIMSSIFLPGNLTWVTWLACGFSLLAFFLSLV